MLGKMDISVRLRSGLVWAYGEGVLGVREWESLDRQTHLVAYGVLVFLVCYRRIARHIFLDFISTYFLVF